MEVADPLTVRSGEGECAREKPHKLIGQGDDPRARLFREALNATLEPAPDVDIVAKRLTGVG